MSRVKNYDPVCRTLTKEDIKRSWLSPVPSHTYAIQLDGLILLEGSTGDYVFHNEKVCFSTRAHLKNGQIITFLRAEEVEYKYLGDFSATPPWASRHMECDKCNVSWTGCWDNFQCPKCGEGELPSSEFKQP